MDGEEGLTRRQLLVGGGAVVGAAALGGGLAVRYLPLRDWYYRLTGAYGPAGRLPPRSQARVTYGSFPSRVLGSAVDYATALPPGTRPGRALPVCFCLPGRGSTARAVMEDLRMADFVAQAMAERGVPPFGLAAVDGGISYWHPRADGEDRLAMLEREFVPYCRREHKLGAEGARTGIIGWSMGGYGALLVAERDPGRFVAVCAASPALWTSYAEAASAAPGAFDGPEDFAAYNVYTGAGKLKDVAVRVDCGTVDPFYPAAKAFVAALPAKPAGAFTSGGHQVDYWRRVAPDEVDFMGHALR